MGIRRACIAAVAALAIAACAQSTDESATAPEPTSPSSDARESPSRNRTPEVTIEAWLVALANMQNTGDPTEFLSLSSTDCGYCNDFSRTVQDVYRQGGVAKVAAASVVHIAKHDSKGKRFLVLVDGKGGSMRPSHGATTQTFKGGPDAYLIGLTKKEQRWVVESFARVPHSPSSQSR